MRIPCFACGHPFGRHRKERRTDLVDHIYQCAYCDCVVRIPVAREERLQVDGRAGIPGVDPNAPMGASPFVVHGRNAPNDAADPSVYLRVDPNTHALHGGVGQACALCSQTIRPGQDVRKRVDGRYAHDVCPPHPDHP